MDYSPRAVLIVLDGVGVGAAPDAELYGDEGSDTLGNTARAVGGLHLPHLQRLGLGNILPVQGVPPVDKPAGGFGRMQERSAGKDTTTGHWELAGLWLEQPFPTYPEGFPSDVIDKFSRATGRGVLGNVVASGTVIIEQLGEEHMATGKPIVYTSADSVFQIAAHEDVIPVEELYDMCRVARELLKGEHGVGRVIARPFTGEPGRFTRTHRRRDFSLEPVAPTVLDRLVEQGIPVWGVGKIWDIFAGRGISESRPTQGNMHTLDETIRLLRTLEGPAFIFVNCIDFDSLWGHRNDPEGMARGLEQFDARVPEILDALRPGDLVLFTADHGNDPTTPGTDHSREYVPLLAWGPDMKEGVDLGTRSTFADVAATLAQFFGVDKPARGESFLPSLRAASR